MSATAQATGTLHATTKRHKTLKTNGMRILNFISDTSPPCSTFTFFANTQTNKKVKELHSSAN